MPRGNLRIALGERRYSSMTTPYRNIPAVAASILLVATAGTLFVVVLYSPNTVPVAGSTALGLLVRLIKLDGLAVLGAGVGALAGVPMHNALAARGLTPLIRATILGLFSIVAFLPLAVIEAIVFRAPPAYWLVLALPAATFGFFCPLLYVWLERADTTTRTLALGAAALLVIAAPVWVLIPAA